MKKIIHGKKYDTDTAESLGYWNNGLDRGKWSFCEEEIYRKKTGEFFLYGCGGPRSSYAKRDGDMWSGGEDICLLSVAEARDWVEDHLSADSFESIFGEVPENDNFRLVSYVINPDTAEKIKSGAAELGISPGAFLDRMVAATYS
jgi:hypothetical protein